MASCLAGALWTIGLLTWHLSRFFLLTEVATLAGFVLLANTPAIRRLGAALVVIVVVLAGGAALTEHLSATRFLASSSFLGLVAVLSSAWLLAARPRSDPGSPVRRVRDRLLVGLVPLAL